MMVRMAVRRGVLVLLVPRLPLFGFARRLVSCLREARAEDEGPTGPEAPAGPEALVEPESTACAEAPTDVEWPDGTEVAELPGKVEESEAPTGPKSPALAEVRRPCWRAADAACGPPSCCSRPARRSYSAKKARAGTWVNTRNGFLLFIRCGRVVVVRFLGGAVVRLVANAHSSTAWSSSPNGEGDSSQGRVGSPAVKGSTCASCLMRRAMGSPYSRGLFAALCRDVQGCMAGWVPAVGSVYRPPSSRPSRRPFAGNKRYVKAG